MTLKDLFGETPSIRLIFFLLKNQDQSFTDRQLAVKIRSTIRTIEQEIKHLERFGFVHAIHDPATKEERYQIDERFPYHQELKGLVVKEQFLAKNALTEALRNIRGIKFLLLSGIFVEHNDAPVDILAVGKINKASFLALLKKFRKKASRPLHYTILSEEEFQYRLDITDRFLYDVLSARHIRVVDKLKKNKE